MYQFFHDVEDELSWIQDRTVMAISKDVGSSLSSVQALLKKHQVNLISLFLFNVMFFV